MPMSDFAHTILSEWTLSWHTSNFSWGGGGAHGHKVVLFDKLRMACWSQLVGLFVAFG